MVIISLLLNNSSDRVKFYYSFEESSKGFRIFSLESPCCCAERGTGCRIGPFRAAYVIKICNFYCTYLIFTTFSLKESVEKCQQRNRFGRVIYLLEYFDVH